MIEGITRSKNELIEDFYLVFQPIFKLCPAGSPQIVDYEILLRAANHCFPKDRFQNLMKDDKHNKIFLTWFAEEISELTTHFPQKRFDINIEPQQLFYQSTWDFLTKLSPYSAQLIIEITERVPQHFEYPSKNAILLESSLSKIKSLGYQVALDDVGSGQNSLGEVIKNYQNIDRLKFSTVCFRSVNDQIELDFLKSWIKLSKEYQLDIVVEGIETEEMAARFVDDDYYCLQQGFYWQLPEDVTSLN
ncbi:EAL domain-containing protein [Liquorilactobacillus capillatus]|nr:EAL domain-containing protein [Liquorilactobacillus capillatus]